MVSYRPEFCPYCGAELTAGPADAEDVLWCPEGDRPVFHNPVPTASVTVVDGEGLLLVERGVGEGAGEWLPPGGHIDAGEQPEAGAARELREETGLRVDPADLELFHAQAIEPREGKHDVMLWYAVGREAVGGALDAGSDARDARFFTLEGFAAGDERWHHVEGERFHGGALDELLAAARDALP